MPPETKEKPAPPSADEPLVLAPPRGRSLVRTIINAIVAIVLLGAVVGAAVILSHVLQKAAGDDARSGRKFPLGAVEVTWWEQAKGPYWLIKVEPVLELNPELEGETLTKAEAKLSDRRDEIIDKMRQRIRDKLHAEIANNSFDQRVKDELLDLVNDKMFPTQKLVTNVWISKNTVIEQRAP